MQTKSKYPALIQTCLDQGAWTLADEELDYIIRGEILPLDNSSTSWIDQTPGTLNSIEKASKDDSLTATKLKAISQCIKEQSYRREEVRATKQLQRHRLLQRRYLELLQDSIHKDNPTSEYVLKRKACEQIMLETTYHQTHFPQAPTNDSLSQKIQNFAIKAQCKPYFDISIWGFAVLRLNYDDDDAWENYKKLIETGAQKLLLGNNVPQPICAMFRFIYLEDETTLFGPVDQDKLVKYWGKNQWNEDVHLHIDKQFFLSVDEFAREGENPDDPPMFIHDASVDEVEEGGFPGFRKTSVFELIMWHIAGIEKSRLHLRRVWEIVHS